MKKYLFFGMLLFSLVVFSQHTVQSVPNPKVANDTWVSNPDFLFPQEIVEQINAICSQVERGI